MFMRQLTCLLLTTCCGLCATQLLAEEATETSQLVQIQFKIYEGDPEGSTEKGTIKTLSCPKLTMPVGQTGTIMLGEELEQRNPQGENYFNGLRCRVTPTVQDNGKIRVEVHYEKSNVKLEGQRVVSQDGRYFRTAVDCPAREPVTLAHFKSSRSQGRNKPMIVEDEWIDATCELVTPRVAEVPTKTK